MSRLVRQAKERIGVDRENAIIATAAGITLGIMLGIGAAL